MGVSRSGRQAWRSATAYTLTELLVVVAIILVLTSLAAAGVSSATSSQKRYRTAALIGKLDTIIATQYADYASRNVDTSANDATGAVKDRSETLREIAAGDLPDTWAAVSIMATKPDAELTPHQRAYKAVWTSILDSDKARVALTNAGAECLFMIVMQGGVADCLDCRMSRIDVGDQDGDNMPEFLDPWGTPISFVLWPTGLRLPAGSTQDFFSPAYPFSDSVPSLSEAKGGLLRPLIFSMGPDRVAGVGPISKCCGVPTVVSGSQQTCSGCSASLTHFPPPGLERFQILAASPLPGTREYADNITNFDEEAKR